MTGNLFVKKVAGRRVSPKANIAGRIKSLDVGSANCTLIATASGNEVDLDIGRVDFYRSPTGPLTEGASLYVTTPDGIKAEDLDRFRGEREILRLWFLADRIPRIVDCRIHLKASDFKNIKPEAGPGFKLSPVTDVTKQGQRNSLRFAHQHGKGQLPVYPQILFDALVNKTNVSLPPEGAIPRGSKTSGSHPTKSLSPETMNSAPKRLSPGSRKAGVGTQPKTNPYTSISRISTRSWEGACSSNWDTQTCSA